MAALFSIFLTLAFSSPALGQGFTGLSNMLFPTQTGANPPSTGAASNSLDPQALLAAVLAPPSPPTQNPTGAPAGAPLDMVPTSNQATQNQRQTNPLSNTLFQYANMDNNGLRGVMMAPYLNLNPKDKLIYAQSGFDGLFAARMAERMGAMFGGGQGQSPLAGYLASNLFDLNVPDNYLQSTLASRMGANSPYYYMQLMRAAN